MLAYEVTVATNMAIAILFAAMPVGANAFLFADR